MVCQSFHFDGLYWAVQTLIASLQIQLNYETSSKKLSDYHLRVEIHRSGEAVLFIHCRDTCFMYL